MQPHQKRVVEEKADLDIKLSNLRGFIGGDAFKALPDDEQERLTLQQRAMRIYSQILGERIKAFLT